MIFMRSIQKRIYENARRLRESSQTMEDIYHIVFSHEDAVMVEDASLVGPSKYMTYGQVRAQTEAAARSIFALMGKTGQYIGLYGENKPQWIILFWAILKSGNMPYLINLQQPAEVSAQGLKDLGAEVTLCLGRAPALGTKMVCYDSLMQIPGQDFSVPFGDGFALSTSGTTLSRKICCYSGKNISEQILNVLPMVRENPGLVKSWRGKIKHLVFLPLYHIFGLEAVLLWYSFFGCTFVFPPDLSPENLLRTVRIHDVTHIFAVPLLWSSLEKAVRRKASADPASLRRLERGLALSLKLQKFSPLLGRRLAFRLFRTVRSLLLGDSVRFCISGGSYIKAETLSLINGLGYSLCNGYGMSEIGITSVELSRRAETRIKGSIGRPVPSVQYRLEEGRLFVRGGSLCERILLNGAPIPMDQWFDTGDLMRIDGRGHYFVEGRVSDVVLGENGENRNPDLAEQAFSFSDEIHFSVLGNELNSELMLVVQVPRDMDPLQWKRLSEEICGANAALPPSYKVADIRFTHDPITAPKDIKVSRARLRNAIVQGEVRLFQTPGEAPAEEDFADSELKESLRRIFAEILGVPLCEVSDNGHFMNDLGGSSLDYFTLISRIDEEFGVTLEFEMEHFHYSLNDFERVLEERLS